MVEFIKEMLSNPSLILFGSITLIQIAPIKINPWSRLFKWIGEQINGELRKDFSELKKDFEETNAENMRWNILDFANSCRNKTLHSKDEWQHVISQLKKYETYTEKKGIANGVIEEDGEYLRELYHERCIQNDFL